MLIITHRTIIRGVDFTLLLEARTIEAMGEVTSTYILYNPVTIL